LSFTDAFLWILSASFCQEESINGAPPSKQTPEYLYLRSMPEAIDTRENTTTRASFHVANADCCRRKDNLYHHLKEKHQSGAGLQNQPVDINHPDQYYTITKEKGQKMPRFNTKSNEYRVTFNELNVQSVPDILKTLQNLFDSVLTDVTKGMQEEDLVQITLECPDLDFPIRLPFMQMNQLTSELLLTEIERVLQSNEKFVLDHCVQLNITRQPS
jgi:hypothetical protein